VEGARFCASCGLPLQRRGDERRLVSVLFADLVGFTTLSETRDPESVKNLVDTCFERLVADIHAFGGQVDKIVGDAVVALFGAPCKMDEIMQKARAHGMKVVEDVAQACGSKYKGKYCGTFGDAGAFSLQLNKILSSGDGGAVVTDEPLVFERMVRFHDQGSFREKSKYPELAGQPDLVMYGQNYRMNEMSGAVAGVQLERLAGILSALRERKSYIMNALRTLPGIGFRTYNDPEGEAGNAIVINFKEPEQAAMWSKASAAEGAGWWTPYGGQPVYMTPFILQQRTADGNYPFCLLKEPVTYSEGMCPYCEYIAPRQVSIFLDPTYTKQDLDDIIAVARKIAANIL
jgi:8-amino-3,8-dideoxy-alpha-D-manno-octulosonate transaminase